MANEIFFEYLKETCNNKNGIKYTRNLFVNITSGLICIIDQLKAGDHFSINTRGEKRGKPCCKWP